MPSNLWRPGRRLFASAGKLIILTGILHTAGQFGGPSSAEEAKLIGAMEQFRIAMGFGMNPSMLDIFRLLTFTMSVTFVAIGAIDLVVAESGSDALIRRLTWLNAIWVGLFLILTWRYQVPPPLMCAVIVELVLVASLLQRRVQPGEPIG